jgi:probable rRNA maturation factor
MGYDHQNDSDAETMEDLERAVLARLRMPDPYLVRS